MNGPKRDNNLSLLVANPGISISPGIHLPCYGPFEPPVSSAGTLHKLLPNVNMEIVHHMILFGGRGVQPSSITPGPTHLCHQGTIMYAWARTGQTTPIGLAFSDTLDGDGFAVGPGSRFEWFALQIHYQQLSSRDVADRSGVELSFVRGPPKRPLEVQLMASWRVRIPPHAMMDECVACRVTRGGVAVAWRNHAHRLARDIYSET